MGKHRPAEQLLADALREVERLQIKSQQEQITAHPRIIELNNEKANTQKDITKLRRQMGISDPDKGWTVTLARLTSQIKIIKLLQDEAEPALEALETRFKEIGDEIDTVSAELVSGDE